MNVKSPYLFTSTCLFCIGVLIGIVLNILQMEYKANLFPHNFLIFLERGWWLIICCGASAIYLGHCYMITEYFLSLAPPKQDLPLTIRCVAAFLGLNHLTARITFSDTRQFLLILLLFCLVFWFLFDRSLHGLVVSWLNSLAVLLIANILRQSSLLVYTDTQFEYVQMCLLCLVFSGGICFANIGRLINNKKPQLTHQHQD